MSFRLTLRHNRKDREFEFAFAYGTDLIIASIAPINAQGKADPTKAIDGRADRAPEDEYSRPRGQKIALSRAMEAMKLSKANRGAVWEEYVRRHRHNLSSKTVPAVVLRSDH